MLLIYTQSLEKFSFFSFDMFLCFVMSPDKGDLGGKLLKVHLFGLMRACPDL